MPGRMWLSVVLSRNRLPYLEPSRLEIGPNGSFSTDKVFHLRDRYFRLQVHPACAIPSLDRSASRRRKLSPTPCDDQTLNQLATLKGAGTGKPFTLFEEQSGGSHACQASTGKSVTTSRRAAQSRTEVSYEFFPLLS